MPNRRYRLLQPLPDGSIIGDVFSKSIGDNFYVNERLYHKSVAVYEMHRWETWQVEGNEPWFQEIKDEPQEATTNEGFVWTDDLVREYEVGAVAKRWANISEFKYFKKSSKYFDASKAYSAEKYEKSLKKFGVTKERIEVTELVEFDRKGSFVSAPTNRYQYIFFTDGDFKIPKTKFQLIKYAIESAINDEPQVAYVNLDVRPFPRKYTQEQLDAAQKEAFEAARKMVGSASVNPNSSGMRILHIYPTFNDYKISNK